MNEVVAMTDCRSAHRFSLERSGSLSAPRCNKTWCPHLPSPWGRGARDSGGEGNSWC